MPGYQKEIPIPGKSSDEIYEKVAADIERFLSKGPAGHVDIDRDAANKEVRVTSKIFNATLHCQDGRISVQGKLSLVALPFKSKIDEGIEKWVAKAFA